MLSPALSRWAGGAAFALALSFSCHRVLALGCAFLCGWSPSSWPAFLVGLRFCLLAVSRGAVVFLRYQPCWFCLGVVLRTFSRLLLGGLPAALSQHMGRAAQLHCNVV